MFYIVDANTLKDGATIPSGYYITLKRINRPTKANGFQVTFVPSYLNNASTAAGLFLGVKEIIKFYNLLNSYSIFL